MSLRIEVKEEAKADLADAVKWYTSKAENLDLRFITAVDATLLKIQRNPTAFKKVYKDFRQTAIKSFPYVIIYKPEKKTIVIFSVFNTWQHPKKKIQRLKK